MVVKRAHDFGNPGTWAFRPLSGFKLLFSEGEAHDNQYGTTAVVYVPSWRVFAGLGIVSIGVPLRRHLPRVFCRFILDVARLQTGCDS